MTLLSEIAPTRVRCHPGILMVIKERLIQICYGPTRVQRLLSRQLTAIPAIPSTLLKCKLPSWTWPVQSHLLLHLQARILSTCIATCRLAFRYSKAQSELAAPFTTSQILELGLRFLLPTLTSMFRFADMPLGAALTIAKPPSTIDWL